MARWTNEGMMLEQARIELQAVRRELAALRAPLPCGHPAACAGPDCGWCASEAELDQSRIQLAEELNAAVTHAKEGWDLAARRLVSCTAANRERDELRAALAAERERKTRWKELARFLRDALGVRNAAEALLRRTT